ncbi:Protein IQ-domain 32 [Apostasia shenzhenica]|uniref:Protein IQ-domain 32 n=1 Tax=Apostasia shenzhenica TaxID=1088818 RepID=A0A2H9ZWK7_9ASPA|nr:Protein IQ-domain 32 [Apostasia shenzhenica]
MGKTTSSCFQIMTCSGGDSASADELLLPEGTASTEKSRWSFRKRSARHRVLSSNNVICESESIGNNKGLDAVTNSFNSLNNVYIQGKVPIPKQCAETRIVSSSVLNQEDHDTNASLIHAEITDDNIQEPAVVVQTAVRGFLALRYLQKIKNIVKLQAAVRGHLVRRRAVGTLLCIRAIAKMQAIFRARLASQFVEKFRSIGDTKLDMGKDSPSMCRGLYYSNKKLLSNGLVQQLFRSTSMSRRINIKCNPFNSDSTWKWMERWMAIASSDIGQKNGQNLNQHIKAKGQTEGKGFWDGSEDGILHQSPACLPDRHLESLGVDTQGYYSKEMKELYMKKQQQTKKKKSITQARTFSGHILAQSDVSPEQSIDSPSSKPEPEANESVNCNVMEFSKPLQTKLERPCSPEFAASQSKMEPSSYECDVTESREEGDNCQVKDMSFSYCLPTQVSIARVASSDCGTEISISSTLDSPDRSDAEGGEIVLEIGALEKHNYGLNNFLNSAFTFNLPNKSYEFMNHESEKIEECGLSHPVQPDRVEEPVAFKLEQVETITDQPVTLFVEGTPRGHSSVFSPDGTPSSELSVNARGNKGDGDIPVRKQRLQGRKLASSTKSESSRRNSSDHISHGSKNTKKVQPVQLLPIDLDDNRRMSVSSSLPNYMQATESARAKVHVGFSPKSNPEFADYDVNFKKKSSLLIMHAKQEFVLGRQHSASQAQHNTRSNFKHSKWNSEGRKWQQ